MHLITVEDGAENSWLNTYLQQAGIAQEMADLGIWLGYKGIHANPSIPLHPSFVYLLLF